MATVYAECRSIKDPTCIRMCVCKVKDGKRIPPKGWELVECKDVLDQYYCAGKKRSMMIDIRR